MRRAWTASLVVCVAFAPATAQWQLTGDAGLARLQQTGIDASGAFTGGATLEAFGARSWIRSSALVTVAGVGRTTAQGLVLGGLLGAPGRARWELSGVVSGFGETDAGPTTSGEALARARFDGATRGVAVGAGTGAVGRDGEWNGLFRAQGDAWWRAGNEQIVASLSAVNVVSGAADHVSAFGVVPPLQPSGLAYADAAVSWRHEHEALSVGATAGWRAHLRGSEEGAGWASADASVWLTRQSALVVSAGRTLSDVVRGVPRTTFVSVAVRLAAKPRLSLAPRAMPSGARLSVVSLGGGRQRIEVRGLDAARLELMSDFTDWLPVELERDGDVWRLERAIPSGLHRVGLRLNGGEWIAPVNLPHAVDELGGVVGLITIP